MISFKILTEESADGFAAEFGALLGDEEYVGEILGSFLELSAEGVEVALSAAAGCLLVRIFERDRYSFVYPIEVSADADVSAALISISEYTRKEMIPLYLTDVPRDELDRLGGIFPHIEARAYDEDEDGFVVCVLSECDMLEEAPSLTLGGIVLGELTPGDMSEYARLCRDESVNRYWGYDYSQDAPAALDEYFLRTAEVEFRRGVAISLAVREEAGGSLMGEAVLFDFDYRGSAMLAIRLLPECQGRGVGTRVLSALLRLSANIGLTSLRARVKLENIPSLCMTEKQMTRLPDEGDEAVFSVAL